MHYESIVKYLIEFQNTNGYKPLSLEHKEFYGSEPFDIAADECVLLDEVLDDWSIPRDFVAKYCACNSRFLPVAGLAYIFDEGETYHCIPLNGPYRLLNLPEGHPEYAEAFKNSFQCFAAQHGLENFVIPTIAVERLLDVIPEWGREKSRPALSADSDNEPLKALRQALCGLTRDELWTNRKILTALALREAGIPVKAIFALLDATTKIDEGSEYTRIRRWGTAARKFLRKKGLLENSY